MEVCNESNTVIKMNLVEQEFCSRSASFNWLSDIERDRLPGPIAFEYKRLREYTEKGNVEASLWKLVNLSNVTLSYLFAAVLERKQNLRNQFFYNNNKKKNDNDRDFSIRGKIRAIRRLELGNKLALLLDSIESIIDWRNDYGTGHGVLLNQSYYINDRIIQYYIDFLMCFQSLPNVLKSNNLSLRVVSEKQDINNPSYIIGANYFNKISNNLWGAWLVCNMDRDGMEKQEALVHFYGYQFDLPDIYFLESVFLGKQNLKKNFRNYSKNRIKIIRDRDNIDWNAEPRQVAWLFANERAGWWDDYNRLTQNNGRWIGERIDILADAAEKFQLIGLYNKAKKSASAVLDHFGVNSHDINVRACLVMYSSWFNEGNNDEAEVYLKKAKDLVSKVKEEETGIFLNAQISAQESWNVGLSQKEEDINSALSICDGSINELDKLEDRYPFSALTARLELRKNKLYVSRNLAKRDSRKLRNETLEMLKEARRLYKIDPENRRTVDIYGFACNLYRRHACDLIDQGDLDQNEVGKVEKIIDEGLEIRKKSLDSYDMDVWSVRGYAWSMHDKGRFLMYMRNDHNGAVDWLKRARDLRQNYLRRFPEDIPEDKGVLMDLITNYCDLYRAEGQPKGNHENKLSKRVSETLSKMQLDRLKKTDAETFERLKKEIEDSGLQYFE